MSNQTIPVVTMRDFTHGTGKERERFVNILGDALVDLGFFAVEDHGVSHDLIKECYALAEDFFSRSEEEKKRLEDVDIKGQRGFTSFGRERAKGFDQPDIKEFFHVGQELADGHPLLPVYGPNVWPEEPARFKPAMLELFQSLEVCAKDLLRACALYIGENENRFSDMVHEGDTILRLIHYPPIPDDAQPSQMRAAPHEDINLITLLCEATAGGLELLQRDGTWRPVHALQGQIVVDTGDMMQHVTNGLYKSTTHQVVNPDDSRTRRFSMPFFVHPRAEVDITPLQSCVGKTGGESKFPSRTAREYLEERLKEIGLA